MNSSIINLGVYPKHCKRVIRDIRSLSPCGQITFDLIQPPVQRKDYYDIFMYNVLSSATNIFTKLSIEVFFEGRSEIAAFVQARSLTLSFPQIMTDYMCGTIEFIIDSHSKTVDNWVQVELLDDSGNLEETWLRLHPLDAEGYILHELE